MLADWVKSDRAAINIRLKQGIAGTWNAVLEAGAGYSPVMWDGEAIPMFFSKKFQTIATYKTNNTGNDVSTELADHFRDGGGKEKVGIATPMKPPLGQELWLRNSIHAASANAIVKTGQDSDLTVNAQYIHDRQDSEGNAQTTYYLPGEEPLTVKEATSADEMKDEAMAQVQFRLNGNRKYVRDRLAFGMKRNRGTGLVTGNVENVRQELSLPEYAVSNLFSYSRSMEKWRFGARSNTGYAREKSMLAVAPNMLVDIIPGQDGSIVQDIISSKFSSENAADASFRSGKWLLSVEVMADIDLLRFRSELGQEDSLRNDMGWTRVEAGLVPSAGYYSDRVYAVLYGTTSFVDLELEDRVAGIRTGNGYLLCSPTLFLSWKLRHGLELEATARYRDRLQDPEECYSGYIMQDYRSVSRKGGEMNRFRDLAISAGAAYADAVNALFCNAAVSWSKSRSRFTYGTLYSGILSTVTAYGIPEVSSGVEVRADISKLFSSISTTVKAGGSWNRAWTEYTRQGVTMPGVSDMLAFTLKTDTNVGSVAFISYSGNFTCHRNQLEGAEDMKPIKSLQQEIKADVCPWKNFLAGISCRHYYNDGISGTRKSLWFLGAEVSYRARRLEYIIEGSNLLGTRYYGSTVFSTNTVYSYTYRLRPLSVVFKVRFSLR